MTERERDYVINVLQSNVNVYKAAIQALEKQSYYKNLLQELRDEIAKIRCDELIGDEYVSVGIKSKHGITIKNEVLEIIDHKIGEI